MDPTIVSLTEYSNKVLFIRKEYLPIVAFLGKKKHTYWLTMPPTENVELENRFYNWFHSDFVSIVSYIVKQRKILLEDGQKEPSKAGGIYGWYLPLAVVMEIQKMWVEENVPLVFDILRPLSSSNVIYADL